MSTPIVFAVLLAALLHATWNAVIRGSSDKALFTLLLSACGVGVGVVGLGVVGWPALASLPYVLASAAIHSVYIVWLMRAYEGGGLAFNYALMRGVPPILVAITGGPLLGETLGLGAWLGVVCICGGVIGIGFASGASLKEGLTQRASRAALLNALPIAAYTLVDGVGARVSGQPLAYVFLLMILEPLLVLAVQYRQRGPAMLTYFARHWPRGLFAASCSIAAYALVLWAMTQAPVALVAALRESSVIFAVLIGRLVFREGRLLPSLAAASAVLLGVLMLKM